MELLMKVNSIISSDLDNVFVLRPVPTKPSDKHTVVRVGQVIMIKTVTGQLRCSLCHTYLSRIQSSLRPDDNQYRDCLDALVRLKIINKAVLQHHDKVKKVLRQQDSDSWYLKDTLKTLKEHNLSLKKADQRALEEMIRVANLSYDDVWSQLLEE